MSSQRPNTLLKMVQHQPPDRLPCEEDTASIKKRAVLLKGTASAVPKYLGPKRGFSR